MTIARLSATLAVVASTFALAWGWGAPAANADPLDPIKDTVTRDRANSGNPDCYPYFYDPDLEAIAQTYARSENPADVANASYNGEKVAFLGSGDPQSAAINSAYTRGAGGMLSNCAFSSFGVGFVRHEDRDVDVVTIVFGNINEPVPAPDAVHQYKPVGPPPAPCPSGGTYQFVGNVIFDLEDFGRKDERGTVFTMPAATADGKLAGPVDISFTGSDHAVGRADGQITGTDVDVNLVFEKEASPQFFGTVTFHFVGYVYANGGAGGTMTSNANDMASIKWHTRTTDSIACV